MRSKNAVTWTRLSCTRFAANAVRLQLHALAYIRSRQLPPHTRPARGGQALVADNTARSTGEDRRRDRPARALDYLPDGRGQVWRGLFQQILDAIAAVCPLPPTRCYGAMHGRPTAPSTGKPRPDARRESGTEAQTGGPLRDTRIPGRSWCCRSCPAWSAMVIVDPMYADEPGIWEMSDHFAAWIAGR